jgi:hypothetical protein
VGAFGLRASRRIDKIYPDSQFHCVGEIKPLSIDHSLELAGHNKLIKFGFDKSRGFQSAITEKDARSD